MPVALHTGVDEADIVLVVQVGSNSLCGIDESLQSQLVAQVLVKVILGSLEVIHVLNGVVVVSHFWERERLVVELLGGHGELDVDSALSELRLDVLGVLPVLDVEVSAELTKLVVQVVLTDLERRRAVLELHQLE